MRRLAFAGALLLVAAAGVIGGYRAGTGRWPTVVTAESSLPAAGGPIRAVLHWRHPDDPTAFSATPARTAEGRDFVPVYDQPPDAAAAPAAAAGERKILFFRNPMGLPDTSPTPKKDWMGMDYIAVYEGEERDDDDGIRVSPGRIQRSGVRTETVARRSLARSIAVPGTVKVDERRVRVVALRSDGFIEGLFVGATGQAVRAGDPLFRVYSPQIQQAQIDFLLALRDQAARAGTTDRDRMGDGPALRLRNLGVPESRIRELRETGASPRTLEWPSPITGVVLEKRVIDGQRAMAGEELYRIADLSSVWVIAYVPEQDLGPIRLGDPVIATFRAYPGEVREGRVGFVYPDLQPDTRTARVRIELPNPHLHLKADMYADVTIRAGAGGAPVPAVPDSALIDSGAGQHVIVARGEGRFAPRAVRAGRRAEGYVEILDGVAVGEEVVVTATFLIDAESNLRAALRALAAPEERK